MLVTLIIDGKRTQKLNKEQMAKWCLDHLAIVNIEDIWLDVAESGYSSEYRYNGSVVRFYKY